MNRARLIRLLLACGLFFLPAVPAAAQYPPSAATVEVSATTLAAGGTLTITGEGWLPDSEVEISIFSPLRALGSVMTDDAGAFSMTVTIPRISRRDGTRSGSRAWAPTASPHRRHTSPPAGAGVSR